MWRAFFVLLFFILLLIVNQSERAEYGKPVETDMFAVKLSVRIFEPQSAASVNGDHMTFVITSSPG